MTTATTYARVGALVFALALAVPDVAEAECAWVLWGVRPDSGEHWPVDGFMLRDKCVEEANARYEKRRQSEREFGLSPVHFTCFPDTIDPRRPKAR